MGIYIVPTLHPREWGRGVGGYSGFQVTGMIELGQKSKRKILRTFNNTPKNPSTKINPQQEPMGHKTYQALNDITQQIKTTGKNSHNYAGGTRTTITFGISG